MRSSQNGAKISQNITKWKWKKYSPQNDAQDDFHKYKGEMTLSMNLVFAWEL